METLWELVIAQKKSESAWASIRLSLLQRLAPRKNEKRERSPDASYLAAVAEQGVNVLYVVTGQRSSVGENQLSNDDLEVVMHVRSLDDEDKGAVMRLLRAFTVKK